MLVVDDDPFMLDMLPGMLSEIYPDPPTRIVGVQSPEEALRLLKEQPPRRVLVLSDYDLRNRIDGLELLHKIASEHPSTIRVLFSGHSANEIGAMDPGVVHGFIEKPFRLSEMIPPLQSIMARAPA